MEMVSRGAVEGYFIFIRKEKDRRFKKITIIGHESHSYVFEELNPGQLYEIKVEAFNFAGSSPPSRISRKATLPGDEDAGGVSVIVEQPLNGYVAGNESSTFNSSSGEDSGSILADDQIALYLIIAGALVGAVLIVVVCCSVASCTRKKRARKAFSVSNVAIHEKYMDTSRHISMSAASSNGRLAASTISTGVGHYNSDQQMVTSATSAETSFSSPNRLSQMLHSSSSVVNNSSHLVVSQPELGVSRNPNVMGMMEDDDELNSSSELDTSLQEKGPYPQTADEEVIYANLAAPSDNAVMQSSFWL
jgi:hypothetical protein